MLLAQLPKIIHTGMSIFTVMNNIIINNILFLIVTINYLFYPFGYLLAKVYAQSQSSNNTEERKKSNIKVKV